jgi:hypothetical protein
MVEREMESIEAHKLREKKAGEILLWGKGER